MGRRGRRGDDDRDRYDPADSELRGNEYIDNITDNEIPLNQLDDFLIPGSDEKGRKVTISFNIPPAMDRQIEIILSARRFPYVNKKDLIRHALVRHMAWITQIRESIPRHYLAMFESINEMVRDDEAATKMEQIFNSLHDRVNDHISRGEQDEVLRLVSHINQYLLQMPHSTWVKRFKDRFYKRYGPVLRGVVVDVSINGNVSMVPQIEEKLD